MIKFGERRNKNGTEEIPGLPITGRPDNLKSRSKSQPRTWPNLAQSRDIPTFSALPHRLICFVSHTCILVLDWKATVNPYFSANGSPRNFVFPSYFSPLAKV